MASITETGSSIVRTVSRKTLASVTDGLSNTLMVGEDIPSLNVHCGWPRSNYSNGTCAIPLNNGLVNGQPGFNDPGDWPDLYSFRSRHTNGANFALGDGSVRFVSQTINLDSYRAAATISRRQGHRSSINEESSGSQKPKSTSLKIGGA